MKHYPPILTLGLVATLWGCGPRNSESSTTDTEMPTPLTKPVEEITPTAEQQQRREASERYCNAHNVPVYSNPNSLFVDTDDAVSIRTQDEVVDRALALFYIGLKSEGLEQKELDELDKDYGISAKLTPKEREYATAKQPTEQQTIDANWRYEGLHVLLWALGYRDSLAYPDQLCDVAQDVQVILELEEKGFRQKAKLRSKQEILDQADLALRLDWACVSARIEGAATPGGMDSGVVLERHHCLNWLIKYMDQPWDEVSTDT